MDTVKYKLLKEDGKWNNGYGKCSQWFNMVQNALKCLKNTLSMIPNSLK